MFDHIIYDGDKPYFVREAPMDLINGYLMYGDDIIIDHDDPPWCTAEHIIERLRIEIIARSIEGRA